MTWLCVRRLSLVVCLLCVVVVRSLLLLFVCCWCLLFVGCPVVMLFVVDGGLL